MSVEIPSGRPDDLFSSHPDILQIDRFDQGGLQDKLANAPIFEKLSEIPELARLSVQERTAVGDIKTQTFIKLPSRTKGARPEWLWLADSPGLPDRLVLVIGASLPGLEEIAQNVIKKDVGLSLFEFTKVDGENPDGEAHSNGERLPPISHLKYAHRAQLVKEGFIGTDPDHGDYWRQFVAYRQLGSVERAAWTLE